MDFTLSSGPSSASAARPGQAGLRHFAFELLTPTHYARLGIAESADAEAIEEAWLRLQSPVPRSPDADEAGGALKAVAWPQAGALESLAIRTRQREVAYAVLSDPARRAVYDAWLDDHRSEITRPHTPRWQAWLHSRRGHWQLGLFVALCAAVLLAWLAA